jgi:hypothetical protein
MVDQSKPADTPAFRLSMRHPIAIRNGLISVCIMLFAVFSYPSHAIHPGVYVCAVDNCKRQFRAEDNQVFEACREGAAHAANSTPSNPACLAMCESTYSGSEGQMREACETGCALFPSRCLRFGELPPRDPRAR